MRAFLASLVPVGVIAAGMGHMIGDYALGLTRLDVTGFADALARACGLA